MKNENTTKTAQTTSSKTEPKQAVKPSNCCGGGWVKECELVDGKPYFVAYGDTVYGVTYSNAYQHFVGFNFHERGTPDLIFAAPELPKRD